MCIRDRYQRRVRGCTAGAMATTMSPSGGVSLSMQADSPSQTHDTRLNPELRSILDSSLHRSEDEGCDPENAVTATPSPPAHPLGAALKSKSRGRPRTAGTGCYARRAGAKPVVALAGPMLARRPLAPEPSNAPSPKVAKRRPRSARPAKPKSPNVRRTKSVPSSASKGRQNKLKPPRGAVEVEGRAAKKLTQSLTAFDTDMDGWYDMAELTEVRGALYGRAGAPFEAGSVNDVLRKHKTRRLTPTQATAQFTAEIESMKDQDSADTALARFNEVAEKRNPDLVKLREVTQADFDQAWKRAQELEAAGRFTEAAKMYAKARDIHSRLRSGGRTAIEVTRRIKQDMTFLLKEQRKEALVLKRTGKVPVVRPEPLNATWPVPRGWSELKLPVDGGRRYYYGSKSGRSVWERPPPHDFSEDEVAPMKIEVGPANIHQSLTEAIVEAKTPVVVEKHDGLLVRELKRHKLGFVTCEMSRDHVEKELKKAMKFGFPVVIDARSDTEESRIAERIDEFSPGLFEKLTVARESLLKQDLFSLFEVRELEKRVLGSGKISENFGVVWLQSDLVLPSWCTCHTSVIFQGDPKASQMSGDEVLFGDAEMHALAKDYSAQLAAMKLA
eukprot:TRINITY_DN290_c0_g1_i2.p1 TRINITY_DN290_c0_g1~~TRINITY_DN290_c0_g1_i2.p1  ORF type:complete len:615 (+),score=112.75 TRINITY_DN290_c0_g1_i2:149-1993(+)